MPKRKPQPGQVGLFQEETTDDVARKTFETEDEKQFKKERGRKGGKHEIFPIPETGSCCDRCDHYQPTLKSEDFGVCIRLVVTAVAYGKVEKGTILGAGERPDIESDPLRCKPWGGQGCSGFLDVQGMKEAA